MRGGTTDFPQGTVELAQDGRRSRDRPPRTRRPGGTAPPPGSGDRYPPQALPHLLHRAAQTADWYVDRRLAVHHLTSRQFFVLDDIDKHPGESQIELGGHTGIDRSTLVSIIDHLQRNGHVVRARSPFDRRAVALHLTDSGKSLMEETRHLVLDIDSLLLGHLAEEHREMFVAGLLRIIASER